MRNETSTAHHDAAPAAHQTTADAPEGGAAMERVGQQAIVIGVSPGGLLAARVLADHVEHVTILERDSFPPPAEGREVLGESAEHLESLTACAIYGLPCW